MSLGRLLTPAKVAVTLLLGFVLYRFAPTVSYRVLAVAAAAAGSVEFVVSDLRRSLPQTTRLARACACCVLVIAFAPWRIAGAALCLAVFAVVGLVVRARSYSIPRAMLWFSPLALGLATWLIP